MSEEKFLWWKKAVIYQIYPRSFRDTTGNGIGDLPGVLEKLPYLDEVLGVDALWLSPFYPSPMKDFGYDVADYRGVDPLFGTLDDFDRLLEESHRRDIRMIIDLVPNHSSDQHRWFQESRSSRDNPKRDWYIWADPKPDGSPPNNWLSVFGGSAWEWAENTGQYYLHSFLKEQPDLNWRNPEVKEAMFDVVRFWLDRGVDGFRIDVAHYILKDPEMRDNPQNPRPMSSIHKPLGEYDSQMHLYDKGHPDVHEIYRELRTLLDSYGSNQPRVSIGETHIFDWEEWSRYYGENLDELHMPYNFSLLGASWSADEFRRLVGELEAHLPDGAWPNYVLGTHDDTRLASRYGRRQARVAAMMLLTLRGTPTIYYGEEIGMEDIHLPPEMELDPAHAQKRDANRSPMQWAPGEQAGFSPPGGQDPWLPIHENYRRVNVAAEKEDPASMLSLYRSLLAVRKEFPVLQNGSYEVLTDSPQNCFCYFRKTSRQTLLIALNFNREPRKLPDAVKSKEILLSTRLDRKGPADGPLTLRPLEGLILDL